ncbi:efflux RND transporter periplasmic adaptor subunit [Zobellia galactanivorans]|uniref:Membrane fusion protein n=1 Tax=Zobellia galactanivorans (strain DSM 12802 / CCUG 47099 / CIP 106680 / NCIMB 13871 / Dsij) TaxID=63186 RepID=G0LAU4_ZOBGA|nr:MULTISPECIES: efflux RND transporter periplasmic adaptor subunit [Zobellia]MDO6808247.1 efflux RND transporter periplasmic adaptor subunit [Zobellia galactanivorans]OWW26620.1 efflux transporter periplasmic adaptor subunit [Zobellia sp. OII3]CAZ95567.1 Membrane fusion protein [Zobellia galactanivorans]
MKKLSILGLLSAGLLLSSCFGTTPTPPAGGATPPPPSLKVGELTPQDITIYNEFSTTLEGKQNVEIWPKVSGFIQHVYVEEGQKIKKGQLLFKLETQTLNQDANAAKASVNVAQVEVNKLKPLVEKNIISEVQLETAKAQLEQAKANYESVASNISYSRITSPVDGYIGEIPFKTGALVSSNMGKPLTTVSDISQVRAYFSLNEKELLKLKESMPKNDKNQMDLEKAPEVKLVMINGKEYPEPGRIAMINTIINSTTGSVTARADFENKNNILSSGSTGKIKIPTIYKNAYEIPQAATIDLQGKKLVYVLKDDNTITTMPIDIIANTQKGYIVENGIEKGTTIVLEGVTKIKDGMTISPVK